MADAPAPDLAVLDVIGPMTAHVGLLNYVTLDVWNIQAAYNGAYQAEIILSKDAVYDANDIVVQTINSATFSTQNVFFTIPANMAGGSYRWMARVLQVAGETNLANNLYVGQSVNILATDLSVVDPSPVVFKTAFENPQAVDGELEVADLGNPGSILLFAAKKQSFAPWLTIDIGDGFAIQGKAPATVVLHCDPTGLPIGSYITTVRLENVNNANDFQDVSVRLEVGNQHIVLGDRIRGQIGQVGETDEVRFDGLAGSTAIFKGQVLAGNLKFQVTLFAPSGQIEKVLNYKNSHAILKKIVILNETGEYRMVFSGKGSTTGSFRVKTDRHNGPLSSSHEVIVHDSGNGTATAPVLMYPGAKLDFSVQSMAGETAPFALTLLDPHGTAVDLSNKTTPIFGTALKVEAVTAALLGEYEITVAGLSALPGGMAKLLVYPVQPPKGTTKVYVP